MTWIILPYVLYGVKYIDLVSLALDVPGGGGGGGGEGDGGGAGIGAVPGF